VSAVVDFLTSNPILAVVVVAAFAFIAYDILVSRRRHRAKRVALGSSIIPAGVLPSSQSAAKSGTVDSLGPGESIDDPVLETDATSDFEGREDEQDDLQDSLSASDDDDEWPELPV
jgi:acid phosphatase family membrane protein YuiD